MRIRGTYVGVREFQDVFAMGVFFVCGGVHSYTKGGGLPWFQFYVCHPINRMEYIKVKLNLSRFLCFDKHK